MHIIKVRLRYLFRILNPLLDFLVWTKNSVTIFVVQNLIAKQVFSAVIKQFLPPTEIIFQSKEILHGNFHSTMYYECKLAIEKKKDIIHQHTSSCIISQTMLRSAIDGRLPPSKNRPLPLSQKFSIFFKDADKIFSASAAA